MCGANVTRIDTLFRRWRRKCNIIFRIERINECEERENPDGTRETRRTISFEREQLKEVFNYKLSKTYRISEKGNKAILN